MKSFATTTLTARSIFTPIRTAPRPYPTQRKNHPIVIALKTTGSATNQHYAGQANAGFALVIALSLVAFVLLLLLSIAAMVATITS